MEVNGEKKNREVSKMTPKVKVSVNILPFGSVRFETPETELPVVETKPDIVPQYIQPLTTNVERFEVHYGANETYLVPKTTAGI
ncbi:hypothetical protein HYR99_21755 [Candidatus Poribacteria bacterium]|nr:hypothetical protein [Candidatus Poribacteria bacterium]